MSKPRKDAADLEVELAAYARGKLGLSIEEVAKVLRCGAKAVGEKLKAAEDLQKYREETVSRACLIPDAQQEQLDQEWARRTDATSLLGKLQQATPGRSFLERVWVVESDQGAERSRDTPVEVEFWEEAITNFGEEIAGIVWQIIQRASVVFCARGRQLLAVARGLRKYHQSSRFAKRDIRFVPVLGEVFGKDSGNIPPSERFEKFEHHSATYIAAELARVLSNAKERKLSLLGSPAMIPAEIESADLTVIKRFCHANRDYREIFGTYNPQTGECDDGLLHKSPDTILASFGTPAHQPNYWWIADPQTVGFVGNNPLDEMKALVCGDFAGVLVPNPGQEDHPKLRAIRERAMGLRLEDLKRIAEAGRVKSNKTPQPGVVAIAVGSQRASVAIEAITKHNIVNKLIIDGNLADAILEVLDKKKKTDEQPGGETQPRA